MAALIITGACLLAFGIWYAQFEARRPIDPTYVAVVLGVGVTMIGQLIMTVTAYLSGYGLTGIVIGIIAPFALTGVPMAVRQEMKRRCFIDEANTSDTGPLGRLRKDGDT